MYSQTYARDDSNVSQCTTVWFTLLPLTTNALVLNQVHNSFLLKASPTLTLFWAPRCPLSSLSFSFQISSFPFSVKCQCTSVLSLPSLSFHSLENLTHLLDLLPGWKIQNLLQPSSLFWTLPMSCYTLVFSIDI